MTLDPAKPPRQDLTRHHAARLSYTPSILGYIKEHGARFSVYRSMVLPFHSSPNCSLYQAMAHDGWLSFS
jgi:hypothetical protein